MTFKLLPGFKYFLSLSILVFGLVTLFLTACNPTNLEKFRTNKEEPCGFVSNNESQRVSWKNNLPITIYLHADFPSEYRESVEKAMKTWEQSLNRPLFILSTESFVGSIIPQQDDVSVIYWLSTWDKKNKKNQANTDIFVRGNEIIEADISVNATFKDFTFYTDKPSDDKQVHLESLLIHELGHILGLEHNEEDASVMKSALPFKEERIKIDTVDIENMKCEY